MKSMSARIGAALGVSGVPRIGWLFAAQTLAAELGFFSLFPILGLLLKQTHGWPLEDVALPVTVFTVAVRCSFLVAPLLARGQAKLWMVFSLLTTAAAFCALPAVGARLTGVLLLGIAGLGISIYLTVSRSLIAEQVKDPNINIATYSLLNLALNLSASIGPLIGGYLMTHALGRMVFWLVAAGYVVAALSVALCVPRMSIRSGDDADLPRWKDMARIVLRHRGFRRFAAASAAGWCLYAQLFATLPLYFAHVHGEKNSMGSLFTLNALIVVVLQLPLTALVTRVAQRPGMSFERILGVGYVAFAAAFLVLAFSGSLLAGMYVAIAVFTFGELVFAPVCNTLIASMGKPGEHVLFFSARGVFDAVGEGLGVYVGIRALTALQESGRGDTYWLALGALALFVSVLVLHVLHADVAAAKADRSAVPAALP